MKVRNSIKKVGAVAGSALMVGLTMGSAATLADFPQPFVDDDGVVQSQVVVGSGAKVADVVGAVNVAAAMGQSAVQTETQTATVSGNSYGWSASMGQTLDTQNDNLYFSQELNNVRQTLTADHLDTLADTTFTDDAGTETDIEYYLYPSNQTVRFTAPDNNMDPVLNVNNPSDVDPANYLYHLQANFADDIDFRSDDVQNEEIELFGKTYTVSADTTADDLVLLGSQEELSLENGETGTITVNGNDHTIEVVAVTESDTAAFRIDGDLRQNQEDETFNLDGQSVRLDTVIQTNSQTSAGLVTFAVGSEELTFSDGDQIQDDDGDDIDGTYVTFQGNGTTMDLSGLNVYIGADDDDREWVAAGESYAHPTFENIEFHFGGLNPDAADEGDSVSEVEFSPSGDDVAQVSFTDGDDSATVEFVQVDASAVSNQFSDNNLADSNGDAIHVYEGAAAAEDEYLMADAGDFDHMWEVRDIDADTSPDDGDEGTVDLRDVVTGSTIEVDVEHESGDSTNHYDGEEVIDGQTYTFTVDASAATVSAEWGDANTHHVYPALDTSSGASIAFVDYVVDLVDEDGVTVDSTTTNTGDLSVDTLVLPSTESTGTQSAVLNISDSTGSASEVSVAFGDSSTTLATDTVGNTVTVTETVGAADYVANVTIDSATAGTPTSGDSVSYSVNVALQDPDQADGNGLMAPSAMVVEPEHDAGGQDAETHFLVTPGVDTSNDVLEVGGNDAELHFDGSDYSGEELDSDSDVSVDYNMYGTYSRQDSDDAGSFTLQLPDGQAVAGAALTDNGGSVSAGGSGGSVTYEALAGMGALPDLARLDSEVTESVRSNNHLVLVGGPAVNSLVATLNDEGSVDLSDVADAESGAVLQVVNDAFTSDRHALVVAGYGAADTRAAARYLSNYADHEQALVDAGERMVLTEADYPSSQ